MPTFQPQVGEYYAKITIDKGKASTLAEYFRGMMESMQVDWTDQFVVIDYSSSIVVWFKKEEIAVDMMTRMVDRGVPFGFDWVEFLRKHLDRIAED